MSDDGERLPLYTRNLFYKVRKITGWDLRIHGVMRSLILTMQALSWPLIYWSMDDLRKRVKEDADNLEKKHEETDPFAMVMRFMPRLVLMLEEGERRRFAAWRLVPVFCLLAGVFAGFFGTVLYFFIGG